MSGTDLHSPGLRERCSLCGGQRFGSRLLAFDRQSARREDYEYARCSACSLLSQRPTPRDEEIPGFYHGDYAPHAAAAGARATWEPGVLGRLAARRRYSVDAPPARGWLGRCVRSAVRFLVRELLDPRGDNRLLDVGCGSGRLLVRHRALGWEVRGIDPSERAVEACLGQGLSVQQADLLEADLPSRHFDVILLNHVIEHVPRPLDALRRARELLAPGGAIVIVTPNVGGLGFRLYGSCWYALDAPRHLHLYDAATLARICESAGLSVESIATQSSARVLAESRHYDRTQGRVLPPGLAARSAALDRSREQAATSRRFRRLIRPVAQLSGWLGYGETLRLIAVDPGRRA